MTLNPGLAKILYPGSFDPPHLGHQALVLTLLQRFPNVPLEIIPSYAPVSAGGLAKKPIASFVDRCAMLQLALQNEIAKGLISLNLIEQHIEPPIFSVKTLMLLNQQWVGDGKVGFVIGQDQVRVFDRWYEPNSILNLVSLVVASRRQIEMNEVNSECEAMLDRLNLEVTSKNEADQVWTLKNGQFIFFLNDFFAPQSSTNIRREMRESGELQDDLLDDRVLSYIRNHNLYQ